MAIDTGLPSTVVKVLETAYGSIQSDIASYLLIPVSTLRRRLKNAERLNVDESYRVVRLARLKDLALDMMQPRLHGCARRERFSATSHPWSMRAPTPSEQAKRAIARRAVLA